MSSYMVSKNPPPPAHESDGNDDAAVPPVTSRLYLHRPAPLDRDAVLRRIRHRRRHNQLRDTLRSMLQAPPPEPEPEKTDGERQQLAWQLDDAFSAP
ncbi:hypothetical protein PR202_ga11993 [Eleusine coracana subsp. coracana]|uniref:Uncharacterized protein n=1 Tax=Eleusine coracana subsp. coracana TaxID=191504 RepID=A0AAV5CAH1_ELECO|nr:hypothetical protein QOZ80_5AG0396360 [Eleusine coracana subsp. coracana]GJM95279.1 hypothetical protein PR202_ga11993 [Eleusine coracana subsp. coracana]